MQRKKPKILGVENEATVIDSRLPIEPVVTLLYASKSRFILQHLIVICK